MLEDIKDLLEEVRGDFEMSFIFMMRFLVCCSGLGLIIIVGLVCPYVLTGYYAFRIQQEKAFVTDNHELERLDKSLGLYSTLTLLFLVIYWAIYVAIFTWGLAL